MVVDPYKPLDQVSCPDTEIRVLPNLGIAVDRVSCPDTDIRVSGTICITCPILHKLYVSTLNVTDMYFPSVSKSQESRVKECKPY